HTIKPIDKETVISSLRKTKCAVVAENHNVHGGLGSAIAEAVCEYFPSPLKFIGIQDKQGEVGVLDYLQEVYQLRAIDIYNKSLEVIKQKGVLG
ncbi:MAG: transketolase C-terminal domain-containing protein, partial [Bacilli bacterium]|nr:transketolase C-terminal domain-containing protein [Bacilli bacterium]